MEAGPKSNTNPHGLTQRELEIAAAFWLSCKDGEPSLDWDEVAKHAGYKNKDSAVVSTRPIRKKLNVIRAMETGDDDGTAIATPASSKKATPKRKKTMDDDVGEMGETPTKRRPVKKSAAKVKAEVKAEAEEPEDVLPKDEMADEVA